jgi:hypothetical protein
VTIQQVESVTTPDVHRALPADVAEHVAMTALTGLDGQVLHDVRTHAPAGPEILVERKGHDAEPSHALVGDLVAALALAVDPHPVTGLGIEVQGDGAAVSAHVAKCRRVLLHPSTPGIRSTGAMDGP